MKDPSRGNRGRRAKRIGLLTGLVAAGAVGGAILMTALPATADPSASPSASSSAAPGQPGGGHGGGGQRADETPLTGTDAEKAEAAALKAVPGATVDRVETDADGAVYEAHVTKADGTKVTVKFDKDFNVAGIEDGMGAHK
jgi:hypothetical protein